MIIDSHLHFAQAKTYQEARELLLKELKLNKVDYAVVIPDNVPNASIPDLDTTLKMTKNDKNLLVMGTINILKEEKNIISKLDNLFKQEKIVGIKIFPGHDQHYPNDKRLIPVFELCIKHDLPLIIHTGQNAIDDPAPAKYNDPKYIVDVAKKYPKLKIVIAHYFWPKVDYCYKQTINFNNIYYDTSALADKEVIKATGKQKIKEILEKTIKNKPDNVVYGSDYACCGMKAHIDLINSLDLSLTIKQKVFYKNAIKLFKLNLPD